ncbi:MAG: alpha/beta fold hydrolase [Marmoricola sp.]
MSDPDLPVHRFAAPDGVELAWRELGEGRPVVLLHGFVSTGYVNWVKYGHARHLAGLGRRVVMPDLRGHGESAKPHDPAAYPPDVLADDGFALLHHLGLDDYDLAGYSLGSRTVTRMLVRGARPGRAVLAGMGLERILDLGKAIAWYRRVLGSHGSYRHGDPEFMTQAFIKTVGGDPEALVRVIEASVETSREDVAAVDLPVQVLMGDQDDDHGSGDDLAELLPQGRYDGVPGSHMGAVARPELGEAIGRFLGPGSP